LWLIGVGVALVGLATWGMWPFLTWISSPTHPVPGEFRQQLADGTYLAAVQTSSSSSSGPLTLTQGHHVDVTSLTVVDPLGEPVALDNGTNQTISRNGAGFSGVAIFDTTEPGWYELHVQTSVDTDAIVVRSLTCLTPINLIALAAGGLGSVTIIAGSVLAVIGAIRWRERRTPRTHQHQPI
jgi:hypothetical protein